MGREERQRRPASRGSGVVPHTTQDDETTVLPETLSAHRSMLLGALNVNAELDIERAFQVHAGLEELLFDWDEFTADEQRKFIRTVE